MLTSPVPVEGYPMFVFYTVALLGAVLIFWRPFNAVLFGVFGIAAKNFHAAIFTRTEFTGAFLNLGDLLLAKGCICLGWIPTISGKILFVS